MLGNVSVVCFLASYVLAFGLECRRAWHGSVWVRRVMLLVGAAGLVAHSIYLVNRSRQADLPPLLSSSHDWLLVLAWMIVAFLLVFTLVDKQLKIGLFLFPLVLVLIISAYFVNVEPNNLLTSTASGESRLRHWAMFHAALLVFGVAGVILGLVFSLMYLVQHTRLKKAQAGGELHLPSLAVLARLNWWAVMISVPLLTLGILSGVLLGLATTEVQEKISFADPVVAASSLIWAVMVVLFFYLIKTDRPANRQMAWLTIWAFSFLLVTMLAVQILTGSNSWVETWHAATPGAPRDGQAVAVVTNGSGPRSQAPLGNASPRSSASKMKRKNKSSQTLYHPAFRSGASVTGVPKRSLGTRAKVLACTPLTRREREQKQISPPQAKDLASLPCFPPLSRPEPGRLSEVLPS